MKNDLIINFDSFKKYTIKFLSKLNTEYVDKFNDYLINIETYIAKQNFESFKKLKDDDLYKIYEKFNIKVKNSVFDIRSYQKFVLKNTASEWNHILENINSDKYLNAFPVEGRTHVFLSYAYDDKLIVCYLFMYFYHQGIYLYVDFMHNNKLDCKSCKDKLSVAIHNSDQFLFLRTSQSEIYAIPRRGNPFYSVRQWCAWEMGAFYSDSQCCKSNEKFYISSVSLRNPFLETFKRYIYVDKNKNRLVGI